MARQKNRLLFLLLMMSGYFEVNLRADFMPFAERLGRLEKQQLPFAAARGLTETARLASRQMTSALPEIFDRPAPFTMRSLFVTPARKDSLVARIGVKDVQARYLLLQQTGGTREPKPGSPIDVPVDAKRDQYGGLGRGAVKRLLAKKGAFVGTIRGRRGIWQRDGRGRVKLLVEIAPRARYRPRFDFQGRVEAIVRKDFLRILGEQLKLAMETAK